MIKLSVTPNDHQNQDRAWKLVRKIASRIRFSPFQLRITRKFEIPINPVTQPIRIVNKTLSEVLQETLNFICLARNVFSSSENGKKPKRALCHNLKTNGEIKYITGGTAFLKREDRNQWRDTGIVTGQIKHLGVEDLEGNVYH